MSAANLSALAPQGRPLVVIVDDVKANRELLDGHLDGLGYDVRHARDGLEALALIEEEEPDLVLLDIEMPHLDGLAVCRRIKAHPLRRLVPVVLITALGDRETRLRGIEAGGDDFLTKPFDAKELLLRTRVLLRERALNKRLDATESVLLALARTVEARDRYTIHHAERVGLYAREIGGAVGMSAEDLEVLYTGGVLHDIGKIGVADAILQKPGALSEEEFAIMRRHSAEGERICLPLRSTTQLLPIIRHHHEHMDGRGYPDHLVGAAIPRAARIAAVADAWDAMVSDRPYRAGLGQDEARARLRAGAGSQWDAEIVNAFLTLADTGAVDRIERSQLTDPTRPIGAS
jgi:putative two-component system response regulator